jgi:hypothetical protein
MKITEEKIANFLFDYVWNYHQLAQGKGDNCFTLYENEQFMAKQAAKRFCLKFNIKEHKKEN